LKRGGESFKGKNPSNFADGTKNRGGKLREDGFKSRSLSSMIMKKEGELSTVAGVKESN